MANPQQLESEVAQAVDLSVVRYSRVWEDHRVLSLALQVTAEDTVLSITRRARHVALPAAKDLVLHCVRVPVKRSLGLGQGQRHVRVGLGPMRLGQAGEQLCARVRMRVRTEAWGLTPLKTFALCCLWPFLPCLCAFQ